MANLDILESRIASLENEILGNNRHQEEMLTTVTDSLLQAHTMISSALSCRDSINTVMDRMVRMDEYLDPMHVAGMVDVECKMTAILEMHVKLKESYEQLKTFNRLQSVLDSENISRIVDQKDRIATAALKIAEVNDMCIANSRNAVRILSGYNDMCKNIKLLFRQMNILLTNLESADQQVLTIEE